MNCIASVKREVNLRPTHTSNFCLSTWDIRSVQFMAFALIPAASRESRWASPEGVFPLS